MINNNRTSRRSFFKKSTQGMLGIIGGIQGLSLLSGNMAKAKAPSFERKDISENIPVPTFAQMEWQDSEIGLIFHFDMPIAAENFEQNNNVKKVYNPNLYNPSKLNTDQWVEAAKACGARYAIFTATHFNGFMQWQSDLYPYGLKQAKWKNGKGDIVADFVKSCYKYDIRPGIYFSTHRNAYWTAWGHYVDWGNGKGQPKQVEYNHICEKMTQELCFKYGHLIQIWYDAGVKTPEEGGPDVLPIFEANQPHSVFYSNIQRSDHRWIGNESGHADYPCWSTMPGGTLSHNTASWKPLLSTGDSEGKVWSPGMVDIPLRGFDGVHSWFYRPGEEHGVYPLNELLKIYNQSVGRNCNLIIGSVINPDGLVPDKDFNRLKDFGKALEIQFGHPLAEGSGQGNQIELTLTQRELINQIVIKEDIQFGERIRSYSVEGLNQNDHWEQLCEGVSVGHKRIQQFEGKNLSKIRLNIIDSIAVPMISKFSVFHNSMLG